MRTLFGFLAFVFYYGPRIFIETILRHFFLDPRDQRRRLDEWLEQFHRQEAQRAEWKASQEHWEEVAGPVYVLWSCGLMDRLEAVVTAWDKFVAEGITEDMAYLAVGHVFGIADVRLRQMVAMARARERREQA